ncbi:hypothetical protein HN592_00665 [Candidatus Woesearchaeota archaeon]|nr:hypothetical protein [Candidatus Woesearchaeota archaeon]MBT4368816.1 hypothetical protein [Candidatus Woesearchaeota archaeon]MBT4712105.1 hypothetical protein [Candidatus Woesearchaeota archaeon]MBT6639147.1 hypothetical protein [Candidatus Woesearchaeota archaeon]MBT7134347.1 hypothetical protein [Candidatus Woesearchaeota archaeon]
MKTIIILGILLLTLVVGCVNFSVDPEIRNGNALVDVRAEGDKLVIESAVDNLLIVQDIKLRADDVVISSAEVESTIDAEGVLEIPIQFQAICDLPEGSEIMIDIHFDFDGANYLVAFNGELFKDAICDEEELSPPSIPQE